MCSAGWAVQLNTAVFNLDGEHPTIPYRLCVCVCVFPPPAGAHVLKLTISQQTHRVSGNAAPHCAHHMIVATLCLANQSSVCPAVISRLQTIC